MARLALALLLVSAALGPVQASVAHRDAETRQRERLEKDKAALAKLKRDRRHRRRRDSWEALAHDLDRAVELAPRSPAAAEVAFWAARAREGLWSISRTKADAKRAVAAYLQVEEDNPGAGFGAQALSEAAQLATRAGLRSAQRLNERLAARRHVGAVKVAQRRGKGVPTPEKGAPSVSPSFPSGTPSQAADSDGDGDDEPGDGDAEVSTSDQRQLAARMEAALDSRTQAASAGAGAPASEDNEGDDQGDEASADEPELSVGTSSVGSAPPIPAPDEAHAVAKAQQLRSALLRTEVSDQLGLKVRRVILDAGHGGKDTGAIGPHGLREKDVSLAIARRLAAKLRAQGLEVVLTRDDDRFVSLDDRTRIANEAHGDLFVSIHCNAARRRTLSGVETWTLNVASDRYSRRLARFENAETERTVSDLRLILADLATQTNTDDARTLAQAVQSSMVRTLRSRVGSVEDHGVKQALFYVLLGAHMPSILVETAFISNPREEKRLRSAEYQEGTAEAIASGVRDFLGARQRLARVP